MSTVHEQLEGSLALERAKEPEIVRLEPLTPMGVLQLAVTRGADIDQLTKLMELQERWESNDARKAFVQAMSDFKREPVIITRDKENKQYGSNYTSIGNLINTVTPFLSKHGLSASWAIDQSAGIKVSCTITHALGHSSEPKTLLVPLDTSGAKNPLQQIKSSITYARIVTFECACGLASVEGNLDDDGNRSAGLDTSEYDRICGLLEAAQTIDKLKELYLSAAKNAQSLGDKKAVQGFAAIKDKRYKELAPPVKGGAR